MKARGSEDLDLTRKGGRKRLVLHGPSSLWISGGSAAEPKHNPAPTNESTQSSPRGATAGIPPPKKKKQLRKFQRLRHGFSRVCVVPTTYSECFKVRLNRECVCLVVTVSSLGPPPTYTHTHFSLTALPRRVLPPTPSRLRGRQGRPTAAHSSWSQAGRGEGGIISIHNKHTASGHRWTGTPKSEDVLKKRVCPW